MIRKALIGTAAAVGLGSLVFGTSLVSYLQTGFHEAREAVRSEVPLEFEIARARQEVQKIIPEIERCMHVIAEQQYDLEQREAEIAQHKARLADQKEAILALRSDLNSGQNQFVYASQVFSEEDVREDLARRFERYKMSEETLGRGREVVSARQRALSANEEKLDNMLSVKKDLAVKLENLEARLNAVRASETISDLHIDDSQLAEAKKLIHELDRRIGTREKLLANEGRITGTIPVEIDQEQEERVGNITERVDEYFEGSEPVPASVEAPAA